MIPKIIHYCWFGRGELPPLAEKCIASWKKYCPDYEFVLWNEDNFDVSQNRYVREAYESKKYAFVTDYVRLYAMTEMGGIYMDTDVEVLCSLERFLCHRAFSGFEEDKSVPTGIMACEKGFPLFEELLHYYDDAIFLLEDGTMNTTTNTKTITQMLLERGLELNGAYQEIAGLALYPREVFCPLENATGKLHKTRDTATIHWFSKSWLPKSIRNRTKITRIFHRIFGTNCFRWLRRKNT